MGPQEIVELVGNALIMVGGISVTIAPRLSLKPHLFYFFLAGHIVWLFSAFYYYDPIQWRLMMLNGVFVVTDIVAIVRRIGLTEKMGIGNGNS